MKAWSMKNVYFSFWSIQHTTIRHLPRRIYVTQVRIGIWNVQFKILSLSTPPSLPLRREKYLQEWKFEDKNHYYDWTGHRTSKYYVGWREERMSRVFWVFEHRGGNICSFVPFVYMKKLKIFMFSSKVSSCSCKFCWEEQGKTHTGQFPPSYL